MNIPPVRAHLSITPSHTASVVEEVSRIINADKDPNIDKKRRAVA